MKSNAGCWINLLYRHYHSDIMMSARWGLESLASRLFTQTFGQTQIKENIKAPRWPVNSPHKGPVTRKMFPFDAVIIYYLITWLASKIALNVPNTCLATFTPHIRNYNDGYYGKPSYLLILEFNVMKVARSLARSKSTQYIHQNKSWPFVTYDTFLYTSILESEIRWMVRLWQILAKKTTCI